MTTTTPTNSHTTPITSPATMPEAARLRREIEAQRSSLGRDLEALGDHVSPGRMVERRRRAASRRLHDMKDTVMGTAEDATSEVADRAGAVGEAITGGAQSLADSVAEAPHAARSHTRGTPLTMGLVSFGLGFVAAAAFPASRREQQMAHKIEPQLERAAEGAAAMARDEADQLAPMAKQAAVDLRDDAMDAGHTVQEQAMSGMAEVKEEARSAAGQVADEAKQSEQP